MESVFDSLQHQFLARLREIVSNTRSTADGKATITFRTAKVEANYTPEIIKKIEAGRLIAIPNVMGAGSDNVFSIYEVADIYPMHYSMLTLDRNQPGAIRKEYMNLIEREWRTGSKSTWIEIIAAPTGYIMRLEEDEMKKDSAYNSDIFDIKSKSGGKNRHTDNKRNNELNEEIENEHSFNNRNENGCHLRPVFIRKNVAPLTGAQVYLLSKETIQNFICYISQDPQNHTDYMIGNLLGVTEEKIPFTVDIEKLIHYHVGVFAFTGSGKSNFTSLIMRKSIKLLPETKFVIFDVSSEYGINLLDVLRSNPSRIIFSDPLRGTDSSTQAQDYLRRHVVPEHLSDKKSMLEVSIEEVIDDGKVRTISITSSADHLVYALRTFGGLLSSLGDLVTDKYISAPQKILVPTVSDMVKKYMRKNSLNEDSLMDVNALNLINSINQKLQEAKLRPDAVISSIFTNLALVLQNTEGRQDSGYNTSELVSEIMSNAINSPRVFIINLPEADTVRSFCAEIIDRIFKYRKNSFSLTPRVVFVFDEAQEFIPYEKRKEDGTEYSSRAVERLLRHGRKYFLHGWISTQRIAHLNTNALQQLHSYFVSTMPRPYDRQLISDTFAIDDAFIDRTLMFQNGDWLMASFKATSTQNVPVFFHAINNEDSILD